MKKIEVHLFSDSSNSGKTIKISLLRIVLSLLAIGAAVAGFLLFSPIEVSQLIFDRQIFKVYQENRALRQEIKASTEKIENAKAELSKTNAMRDSLFSDKTMRHIMQARKGDLPLVTAKENLREVKEHQTKLIDLLQDNQKFARSLPIIYPLKGQHTITNRYQMLYDPFTEQTLPHKGIDFSASVGDTVFATGDAVVLEQRTHRGFGVTLKLEHAPHIRTFYAHLKETLVPVGKSVKRGEPIAVVGNSGRATGTVLHYEIRYDGNAIDPEDYFIFKEPN